MPILQLDQEARRMLENFRWDGNIRQLKNITEQISIIEKDRIITPDTLRRYLPRAGAPNLPVLYSGDEKSGIEFTERELLYKVLFEMRRDISELKRILSEVIDENQHPSENLQKSQKKFLSDFDEDQLFEADHTFEISTNRHKKAEQEDYEGAEILEESLSLTKREEDLIRKALEKHHGKRKAAAEELGISERTLYRKIKEYNI
jgi:transcriptional regulator with PAS, ATPase and Fis domain